MAMLSPVQERNVVLPDYLSDFLKEHLSGPTSTASGRESSASSCFDTELDVDEFCNGTFDDIESVEDTGKMAYIRACENLGVVPVKRFLEELDSPQVRITHRNLGIYGSKAIASALVVNKTIQTLDLSNNMIGNKGATYIVSAIVEKDLIQVLILSGNCFSSESAEIFAEFLQRSKRITKLNLSGNNFNDNDAIILAESLKRNKILKELDLSHNKLTYKAGAAFGEVLTFNTTLRSLSLGWNQLGSNGAVALSKGIAENEMLKTLDLSWNGIDSIGACAIATSLEDNTQLVELKLACNRISDKGLLEVVKILVKCHLQNIDLSRNPFLGPNEAVETLLNLLIQNQIDLKEVDLGQIQLSKEAMILLDSLKAVRPEVEFHHGYKTGNSYQAVAPQNVNPCDILTKYATTRSLSVLKFFQMLGNADIFKESISNSDFANALRMLKMLNDYQINEVIDILDEEKKGMVDYSDFMMIFGKKIKSK